MTAKKKSIRRVSSSIEFRLPPAVHADLTAFAKLAGVAVQSVVKIAMAEHVLNHRRQETQSVPAAAEVDAGPRFTKLDKDDRPLPESATDWQWVHDAKTGFIWPAEIVEGKCTYDEAQVAAKNFAPNCVSAEVDQVLTVIDYTRSEPAVNTTFFRWKPRWVWTATKAAAPLGGAFIVDLDGGGSGRAPQDFRLCALAVRVGQFPRPSAR